MPRVIIAMPINDEINLLQAHLGIYDASVVSKFIVAEAPWTHSLDSKPLHVSNYLQTTTNQDHKDRIVCVVTSDKPDNGGYANEYAHSWIHVDNDIRVQRALKQRDARVLNKLEFLWSPHGPIYKVISCNSNIIAEQHDTRERRDMQSILWHKFNVEHQLFVRRYKWTAGDMRCLAEGVQRNFLDKAIRSLDLESDDLIIICDVDEFIDPVLLRALKLKTWDYCNEQKTQFRLQENNACFRMTNSRWNDTRPDCDECKVTGDPEYGLPFPVVESMNNCYYGVKLCLTWNIFSSRWRKTLEWGRRQETAILTTWGAYDQAPRYNGTFGKRVPSHFRRQTDNFPQIGVTNKADPEDIFPTCGWHLSWQDAANKLLAYAEWSKEEGKSATTWMKYCIQEHIDPHPIVKGAFTDKDVQFTCFDRENRQLVQCPCPLTYFSDHNM